MTAATTPSKKKWGAVTIVLVVFGGLVLVGVIAAGIGISVVMSSEEGRGLVGKMGKGYKLVRNAQTAPGTKELRAMGCSEAMVMASDDVLDLMSNDGGAGHLGLDVVVCQVGFLSKAIECDDVARKYVATVGARPRPFVVNIQKIGAAKPVCMVRYDGSGTTRHDVSRVEPPSDE